MDVDIDAMRSVGRNLTAIGADLGGDVAANAESLRSGGQANDFVDTAVALRGVAEDWVTYLDDTATAIGDMGAKVVYAADSFAATDQSNAQGLSHLLPYMLRR